MESKILSSREISHYTRQLMLPEIGIEGQEKIKKSKVLVVGAGGLGCPVLLYLTAAGVGKLGIAEFDTVQESNLHRQILYGTGDIGKLKSVAAKETLMKQNEFTDFETYNIRIDRANSGEIFRNYDIIVDATDNLESRYIINDTCIIFDEPMVHGSVWKYEGIVSVFNYKGGPTYRCYNPHPGAGNFRNPVPAESGLFGILPGITGIYMANEVIKIITGTGEILAGKVLHINTIENTFRMFSIKNIPANHNVASLEV